MKERVYRVDEEALPEIEERLLSEELLFYAIEENDRGLFLKSYDERIDEVLKEMGLSPVEEREVDPLEWTRNQLREPFEIADGVIVDPVGDYDEVGIVLKIPPGIAFGTGLHATTKLCASEIKRLLRVGMSFLDIGTGSGILSILAAKLRAKPVVGVDIDEEALEVARQNALRNGVEVEFRKSDLLESVDGKFDFIVANIVPDVLKELAGQIGKVVKEGTILVLSGIDVERVDEVLKEYKRLGFVEERRREMEGWVSLTLRFSRGSSEER